MRFIKLALISIVFIFLMFTLIGLLMPSSVTVGRTATINAPIDSVKFYINNLHHWKYWLPEADTNYFDVNNKHPHLSNPKIMYGNYKIILVNNDSDKTVTVWKAKHGNDELCTISLQSNNINSTDVNWSFITHLHWYPWQRLTAMLRDKIVGPSMDSSLAKLKQVAEKN